MRALATSLMAAILVGVAACGPDNGLNLATVQGKVTYKGKPIKNGTVMFVPDESKGATGPQAIGTIKSDGTYILSSQDADDGAVVGMHKVGILGLDPEPTEQGRAWPAPKQDPMKYLQQKTQAGLKAASQSMKKDAEQTVNRPGWEDLSG